MTHPHFTTLHDVQAELAKLAELHDDDDQAHAAAVAAAQTRQASAYQDRWEGDDVAG